MTWSRSVTILRANIWYGKSSGFEIMKDGMTPKLIQFGPYSLKGCPCSRYYGSFSRLLANLVCHGEGHEDTENSRTDAQSEREDNFHESQSESFGTIMRVLCILYTLRLTEALGNTGPN